MANHKGRKPPGDRPARALGEKGMAYEYILVDREQGVAILTMNRPNKLNAMNHQLATELHDAVQQMSVDEAIGCIVITGAGERAFSAGGDIHEQREDDRTYTQEALDARNAIRLRRFYDISACPKPTIGMMNGLAYGGAAVLASSLDMRIGCEHCRFRFLAAAYGRINSTWTLPNQIGWPIAKELLFSGRVVEAEEAYRIGLLNHLVPCTQLRQKTMELATMIASNRREAIMGVKALLLKHMGHSLEEQWALEWDYTTNVVRGAKAEDAFPEFIARKGRPRWPQNP
jgi:enoyl-CoA hydratase